MGARDSPCLHAAASAAVEHGVILRGAHAVLPPRADEVTRDGVRLVFASLVFAR